MKTMMSRKAAYAGALALGAAVAMAPADANALLVTGLSGNRAASADFSIVGGDLQVILTNTSTADVLVPIDVLTAVFFNISGVGTLTPVSALLTSGSVVLFGPDGGGNVGGEWRYNTGIAGPLGATMSIQSAGYDLPASAANFNGSNLQGPVGLDGLQYGITSAGDNSGTGNTPVTGGNALIKNSVTFLLSAVNDITEFDISNVSFQYGTGLTEPNVPGTVVPVPAALPIIGAALAGFGFVGWRQQRKPA